MSRKKAVKGKGSSNTPSSSPSSEKEKGKKVPTQSNGVVHPSRPSLSYSGEFYDISFKVHDKPLWTARTQCSMASRLYIYSFFWLLVCFYIYIYAFSRRFYPKWLTLHSSYSFYISSALFFVCACISFQWPFERF